MGQSDTIHLDGNAGREQVPGHRVTFPGPRLLLFQSEGAVGEKAQSPGKTSYLAVKWLPLLEACQMCRNMAVAQNNIGYVPAVIREWNVCPWLVPEMPQVIWKLTYAHARERGGRRPATYEICGAVGLILTGGAFLHWKEWRQSRKLDLVFKKLIQTHNRNVAEAH